ncbi:unnamed protein product [Hapterophycus canaliculatus]
MFFARPPILFNRQLLADRQVRFAGYMQPHPLENKIHIKVQTNGDNTPVDALSAATEDLSQEMESLREVFQEQVAAAKNAAEQEQFGS